MPTNVVFQNARPGPLTNPINTTFGLESIVGVFGDILFSTLDSDVIFNSIIGSKLSISLTTENSIINFILDHFIPVGYIEIVTESDSMYFDIDLGVAGTFSI
jgi:hypothetical protein